MWLHAELVRISITLAALLLVIPQLAGDPQIASLQASLLSAVSDALADCLLIAICSSAVDVSVASLNSVGDDIGSVVALKVPGPEAIEGDVLDAGGRERCLLLEESRAAANDGGEEYGGLHCVQ